MLGHRGAQPGLVLLGADALGLDGLEVVIQCGEFFLRRMERLLRLILACFQRFYLLLRGLEPPRARERARPARGRTAGHRAAGLQNLAVQRDDAEAVAVRPGECQRGVHIFRNDRACEQVLHDGRVAFIKRDQAVCGAEAAFLRFEPGFPQGIRADGIDRQEGRAAAVRAFQIFNAALAVRRRVHHNGGCGRAERDVDRGHELVLGRDQRRHRAVHAVHRAALDLLHDRLDRARKALVVALHVGQHFDAVFGIGQRCGRFRQLGLQGLDLFTAAVRLERHALHLVFRARERVEAVAHTRFQLIVCLLFGFQPLARSPDIGCDRIAPPIHAGKASLGRRAVERERVQLVLPLHTRLLGLFQVALGLRAGFGLRRRLSGKVVQPRGESLMLGVQQFDARPALRKLRAQILRLLGALDALALRTVDVVFVVLDIGFEDRCAARLLGGALLGLAQLLPQAVGLAVDVPHVLGKLLRLLVQRLLRLLGSGELIGAGPGILLELCAVRLDAVEREQPERNLEHAQLVA